MEAAHNLAMRQAGGANQTIPNWFGFALRELHALKGLEPAVPPIMAALVCPQSRDVGGAAPATREGTQQFRADTACTAPRP